MLDTQEPDVGLHPRARPASSHSPGSIFSISDKIPVSGVGHEMVDLLQRPRTQGAGGTFGGGMFLGRPQAPARLEERTDPLLQFGREDGRKTSSHGMNTLSLGNWLSSLPDGGKEEERKSGHIGAGEREVQLAELDDVESSGGCIGEQAFLDHHHLLPKSRARPDTPASKSRLSHRQPAGLHAETTHVWR